MMAVSCAFSVPSSQPTHVDTSFASCILVAFAMADLQGVQQASVHLLAPAETDSDHDQDYVVADGGAKDHSRGGDAISMEGVDRLQPTIEPSAVYSEMREVFDFEEMDLTKRAKVEKLRKMKPDYVFYIDSILNVFVLFNAISTVMIIMTNFRGSVPGPQQTMNGSHQSFVYLFDTLTYAPLAFFLMIVLFVNNHYSERTFYLYLTHRVIIDFPESAQPLYMIKRPRAVLFLVYLIGYVGLAIFVLISYAADFGTVTIFANNMAVGVGLLWFKAQSIEDKFVSLSTFIQSFPDETGDYDNIDATSLGTASEFLTNLTLAESRDPAYTSLMRLAWWRRENFAAHHRFVRRVAILVLILALAGGCFGSFFVLTNLHKKAAYERDINPCVGACVRVASNATIDTCALCLRLCLNEMKLENLGLAACNAAFSVLRCGGGAFHQQICAKAV